MVRMAVLAVVVIHFSIVSGFSAEFTAERDDDGVTVQIDGKLFARYVVKSGNKPIIWPIIGPTGKEMTRAYPMRDASPSEAADHIHHRSLWFTHGDVNGTKFWEEERGSGSIVHREFLHVAGGTEAVVATRNEWIDANDEVICADKRVVTFGGNADVRWIDFDITLTSTGQPVKFGDTKEGSFGVRVPDSMRVEANQGGKIVNAVGDQDKDTWGKKASWVDYHGPVEGERLGIAIMNHPTSFRFPTYWHVRTYGLFAANPWGLHNFENSDDIDGSHILEPGDSLVLRYRVLLHKGNEQEGQIPEAFVDYAKLDKNAITATILQDDKRASDEPAKGESP